MGESVQVLPQPGFAFFSLLALMGLVAQPLVQAGYFSVLGAELLLQLVVTRRNWIVSNRFVFAWYLEAREDPYTFNQFDIGFIQAVMADSEAAFVDVDLAQILYTHGCTTGDIGQGQAGRGRRQHGRMGIGSNQSQLATTGIATGACLAV